MNSSKTQTLLSCWVAAIVIGLSAAKGNCQTTAQGTPAENRPALSLDGRWEFMPDLTAEGERRQFWTVVRA